MLPVSDSLNHVNCKQNPDVYTRTTTFSFIIGTPYYPTTVFPFSLYYPRSLSVRAEAHFHNETNPR